MLEWLSYNRSCLRNTQGKYEKRCCFNWQVYAGLGVCKKKTELVKF